MNNRILITGIFSSILFIGLAFNAQVETPPSPPPPDFDEIHIIDDEVEESDIDHIFDVVDEMPEFKGGMEKLYEFLSNNINYPEMARENTIQGRVYVQFVVWKDGSIRDINVIRGVHKILDDEAIRVIKMMPNWKPGYQRGKPVNSRFTLPIKFKIQGVSSNAEEDKNLKAKKLIREGHKIKNIIKETGLSKKEVKALKKELR